MPTKTTSKTGARKTPGRVAQTRGVSLSPAEIEDLATVEALTGAGISELYHECIAPQVRAAADMLLEIQRSGMEMNRSMLGDVWDVHMTPDVLTALYAARSELTLGD